MGSTQTIEFNIIGQICPSSLLIALREINSNMSAIKNGTARLLIRTDNRDCTNTIPEAAGNMGLKVAVEKIDGSYTILIANE